MTKVLTQVELLSKLTGEQGWETWLGYNAQPSYAPSALLRVTGFSADVADHAQIRPVLDYEAAVVVQLTHPCIVPTVRAGMESHYWFAAELVAGESLGDVVHQLRERGYPTLTVPLTLAIGSQVCEALHAAHSAKNAAGWSLNAVHGGIDLDAILLTYAGGVRVREFGIGKARRQAWLSRVGSLDARRIAYFSPEEVRGRAPDARSDVYGVGAVLYELLTGVQPVGNHDTLKAITDGITTPPSAYNPKVTPQLDQIVMRALAGNPADRFENCDHLRFELARLNADPSKALERIPRILSQLFPGHQETWAELAGFERRKDWSAVQVALTRLLSPVDMEPTAVTGVPSSVEADIDDALDALSPAPMDVASTARLDSPPPRIRTEDVESTLQTGAPPRGLWTDEDAGATLPTGVAAEVAPSPEQSGDVARTHAAYKPVPMPEPVSAPSPAPDLRLEPSNVVEAPAAVMPEPVAPVPSRRDVPATAPSIQLGPADDDDDEDEAFVEPFAVAELVEAPELAPREASSKPVLEIIRTANGRALDITVLTSGLHGYSRGQSGVRARMVGKKGTVKLKQPLPGWVRRGRNPREDAPTDTKLTLAPGDAAELREGDVVYHFRMYHPPAPPKAEREWVTAEQIKIYAVAIALSLVMHGVGGLATLLTSYLGVELTVKTPEQAEVFAEGALPKEEKKEVEKPKPEPKKVEKPKPKRIEPKPSTDPTEAQAKIPKAVRQQLDKRLKSSAVSSNEDKADRLVSALSTPVKGDGATIKDVVTNIDAVARPGARGAAFNVTGTLGNLPEGGVNIATSAGGNRIGDIGGSVASDVGKLDKREGTGKVRGKARGMKALAKVQGTLSSGEVYEVIQRHTGQIQACYEKQLAKNPGLAGKLTFEWMVKTNGQVGTVKEVNNTLGDAGVSKCVSGVIKTMKFPRPKGGEVTVVFPWIFKAG